MIATRVTADARSQRIRVDDVIGRGRAWLVSASTSGVDAGHWVLGPRCRVRVTGPGRLIVGRRTVLRSDAEISVAGRCVIGDDVFVNRWFYLSAFSEVLIGNRVRIGERVSIHDENHSPRGYDVAPVRIDDGAWLGAGVIVLAGASVGAGAIVAAGAVVRDDVPAGTLAAGVPARVLRSVRT
jgi:acetyltransferase-like isoleucine patch superfamily enzyme